MSPILGIWASQISGRLWEPQGAYDALSTVTVPSGGVASITFAAIPNTYKHLQLRMFTPFQSSTNAVFARANADAGANYTFHQVYGTGSVAGASASTSETWAGISASAPSSGSNAVCITDILDYGNTNKYKTFRSLTGTDANGSGGVSLRSNLWLNTAAITSLTLLFDNSQNLPQHSQFTLYGVR